MEVNLNCDLGEKSEHYDGVNDSALMELINTANIACGYHAGNKDVIDTTIKLAKKNSVSIGAHPGFADKKNFGRKRINLDNKELKKLVFDQIEIVDEIAKNNEWPLTHVKPHGALNNMACENFDMAFAIGESIKEYNQNLIYLILPFSEMEKAAQKLKINYACEIFADRNYEDNGHLISRSYPDAIIKNEQFAAENILEMINNSAIKCFSGKQLKCTIDSICIHGDNANALEITKKIGKILKKNNVQTVNLNNLKKFK